MNDLLFSYIRWYDHISKNTNLEYTKTSILVYLGMPNKATEYKVILTEKVLEKTFFKFPFHWLGAKLSRFSYFQGLTLVITIPIQLFYIFKCKIFLVCTRFHNEKSLPVRQITWIMLTKTEIMRTISHFFGQNYFHNHDQNFKLCTHYENNFDQFFFAFSKLFIEPNFWTNFRFRLIWDSVRLSLFGRPRFELIWNSVRSSLFGRPRFKLIWNSVRLSLFSRPRFGLIWNSVRLSLFSRPRFGFIGNYVQLSPLVFLGCRNVAFFIMEASTDQKNFHDIMRINYVKGVHDLWIYS